MTCTQWKSWPFTAKEMKVDNEGECTNVLEMEEWAKEGEKKNNVEKMWHENGYREKEKRGMDSVNAQMAQGKIGRA